MKTNVIYNEDCLSALKKIPDGSIDTIVTSPPYNKAYWSKNRNMDNGFHTKSRRIEYENFDDCMNPDDYNKWQTDVIRECLRVLKPEGSLFYNHIDILSEHNTIHPTFVYQFPIKQIIIWNRGNTPKLDVSYFFPITEYIFWIKKTQDAKPVFDRSKCFFKKSVWDILPEQNNSHPAPFPMKLACNCIAGTCGEGGIVLDPFMGSGTTALAALECKCQYIGCELSPQYVKTAEKRIKEATSQLKLF